MKSRSHALLRVAPAAVFALGFMLLGYLVAHALAYAALGLGAAAGGDHDHLHGYFSWVKLAGGALAALGWVGALAALFRWCAPLGDWLGSERGPSGRRQLIVATVLPAGFFVIAEFVERWAAGETSGPTLQLLVVGVLAQMLVGRFALRLVRAVLRLAEKIVLGARPTRPSSVQVLLHARPVRVDVLRTRPMAANRAGRAPPRRMPMVM